MLNVICKKKNHYESYFCTCCIYIYISLIIYTVDYAYIYCIQAKSKGYLLHICIITNNNQSFILQKKFLKTASHDMTAIFRLMSCFETFYSEVFNIFTNILFYYYIYYQIFKTIYNRFYMCVKLSKNNFKCQIGVYILQNKK